MFLMLLRDETIDYKETKIIVEAFWQREIFDLEIVKYLNFSKCLTTHSLICLG